MVELLWKANCHSFMDCSILGANEMNGKKTEYNFSMLSPPKSFPINLRMKQKNFKKIFQYLLVAQKHQLHCTVLFISVNALHVSVSWWHQLKPTVFI